MMGLEFMRTDNPALKRDMIAQQRVGDDTSAAAEIFA
jgi:hypothetical protein